MNIAFYSPFYFSTAGHRNIFRIVREVVTDIMQCHFTPLYSDRMLYKAAMNAHKAPIDCLLVDFPDTGHRRQIIEALAFARGSIKRTAYLSMYAPARDMDPHARIAYDCVIGVEPYWSATVDGDRMPDTVAAPLYNSTVRQWQRVATPTIDEVLVCETGTVHERDLTRIYAREHFPDKTLCFSRSLLLDSGEPLAARAGAYTQVLCAGGYSMTWELALFASLKNVSWAMLPRDAEDVSRRIIVANAVQAALSGSISQPPLRSLPNGEEIAQRGVHALARALRELY